MILTEEEARKKVEQHSKSVSNRTQKARELERESKALIKGINFHDVLINRIEHLESAEKAKARKKYSRSIKDVFERLFRLYDNVYHSTGFNKKFSIDVEKIKEEFTSHVNNIDGSQSLQDWHEAHWLEITHTDPNGLIFYEYNSKRAPYPTYKSSSSIRHYEPRGESVDYVIFEPKKEKDQYGRIIHKWRIVDDRTDRMYKQVGATFSLIEEESFFHPFWKVPAVICSPIEDLDNDMVRVSYAHPIMELMKEYARDMSIKTIYKFTQGFPLHWRYVQQCRSCTGTGKDGTSKCKTCDGHGYYKSKDITDIITLPVPTIDDPKLAPDIAGHIKPDLETWDQYSKEIETIEHMAFKTLWGTQSFTEEQSNTATGRFIDAQPIINKLGKVSDFAQYLEKTGSDLIYCWWTNDNKFNDIAHIFYGRNFIVQPLNAILEDYQNAKKNKDTTVILDRLLNEYITSKYKNDPIGLQMELKKSDVEPFIHYSPEEVNTIFGQKEAQKKMLFSSWWSSLDKADIIRLTAEELKEKFNQFTTDKTDSNDPE